MLKHGRLFTYGTLKRGGEFHQDFMIPYTRVCVAGVRGELKRLRQGYFVLCPLREDLLLVGTRNFKGDLPRQNQKRSKPQPPDTTDGMVRGELFYLPNPHARFPIIDAFEDLGKGKNGPYQRVLLWAWVFQEQQWVSVWTYVRNPEYPIELL